MTSDDPSGTDLPLPGPHDDVPIRSVPTLFAIWMKEEQALARRAPGAPGLLTDLYIGDDHDKLEKLRALAARPEGPWRAENTAVVRLTSWLEGLAPFVRRAIASADSLVCNTLRALEMIPGARDRATPIDSGFRRDALPLLQACSQFLASLDAQRSISRDLIVELIVRGAAAARAARERDPAAVERWGEAVRAAGDADPEIDLEIAMRGDEILGDEDRAAIVSLGDDLVPRLVQRRATVSAAEAVGEEYARAIAAREHCRERARRAENEAHHWNKIAESLSHKFADDAGGPGDDLS